MTDLDARRANDVADACDLIFDRFNRMMEVEFGRCGSAAALRPSGLSHSSVSQAKPAAAIAKEEGK